MQYTTFGFGFSTATELFYQDFKDTFVCNTQPHQITELHQECCFIRISKILLYAIHNTEYRNGDTVIVVLSGFQRYFCMQYTTALEIVSEDGVLFYQDFKDTFVCNTQHSSHRVFLLVSCFIRISKILLYAIHNV